MKYIASWSFDFANLDKLVEKNAELIAKYEKGTKEYPRVVFGPYSFVGESGGFVVLDVDDPEQLVRWALHYAGLSEWSFVPIYSTAKSTQMYLQSRK